MPQRGIPHPHPHINLIPVNNTDLSDVVTSFCSLSLGDSAHVGGGKRRSNVTQIHTDADADADAEVGQILNCRKDEYPAPKHRVCEGSRS
jgi:hypothetical protein